MTERTDAEIRADLATEEGQGGARRLSPIGRLVADVAPLLARAERAEAQVRAVGGDIEKLRGDVHHLLQPIIGHLRWLDHKGEPLTTEHAQHMVDRLYLVLALMDEAASGERATDEHRGRHGVGLNHYPALAAGLSGLSPQEGRDDA